MKQNRYRKCIGMSIFFLFTLQILFVPVLAYDELTPKTEYSEAVEIIELRDKFTRHFKLNDETSIAVAYPEPVNYIKNGVWEVIDNTLQLNNDENIGIVYQNRENSYKVSFPQTLDKNNRISIEKDNYEISWQITTANRIMSSCFGDIVPDTVATSETTDNDDIFVASKSTTRFIYKSLFDDIDLLYTVKPDAVKEDIIINRPIVDISFAFDVNVKGLTAKKKDDNSISFYSADGEDVFVIQSPYMTDSAEEPALSAVIELNINETESGYKIDLIPDSDWIVSPDRVFPIYIDPTVYSSQIQSDIVDTYVHYGDSAGDHTLADRLVVGTKSGELCRSFIKTLIPSLPSGSYVTDARLNLSITYGTSTMQNINVYRVNDSWSSYTMTWAIQNSISKTLIKSNVSATAYSNYPSSYRYSCDVTNTIIDIYNGVRTNHGFMIKYSNEAIDDYNRFYSSDYSTSTVRPTLAVSYSIQYPTPRTISVQCVCDETYCQEYTYFGDDMAVQLGDASYPFKERFNLNLNCYSMAIKDDLPADDCTLLPNPNHMYCTTSCSIGCSQDFYVPWNHHKNGQYAFTHSLGYTLDQACHIQLLYIGSVMCAFDENSAHYEGLLGLAQVSGNHLMARVQTAYPDPYNTDVLNIRIIQHEMSHIFGCLDYDEQTSPCTLGQLCIMHGGFDDFQSYNIRDIWCDNHRAQFDRNRDF